MVQYSIIFSINNLDVGQKKCQEKDLHNLLDKFINSKETVFCIFANRKEGEKR